MIERLLVFLLLTVSYILSFYSLVFSFLFSISIIPLAYWSYKDGKDLDNLYEEAQYLRKKMSEMEKQSKLKT